MHRKCGGFSEDVTVRVLRRNKFLWLPVLGILVLGPAKYSLGIVSNPTKEGFAEFEHGHFKADELCLRESRAR